jgi:hypothetical protein
MPGKPKGGSVNHSASKARTRPRHTPGNVAYSRAGGHGELAIIIGDGIAVGEQHRHYLGEIHATAAANPQHNVGAEIADLLHAPDDGLDR